jgi:hypothetical protein
MARPERFELPTDRFVADYSIQLSYGRFINQNIIFLYLSYVKTSLKSLSFMAEREGFEPSMGYKTHTPLAGERLQPLGHLSKNGLLFRVFYTRGLSLFFFNSFVNLFPMNRDIFWCINTYTNLVSFHSKDRDSNFVTNHQSLPYSTSQYKHGLSLMYNKNSLPLNSIQLTKAIITAF